jgi:hypothetical protein
MEKTGLYRFYIGIGFLYGVVKVVFVLAGYLHPGAIIHGLIPAVLTVAAGFLAGSAAKKGRPKSGWSSAAFVLPLVSLIGTPIFMYAKQRGLWLDNGRLPVLIIYEVFAVAQAALVLLSRRSGRAE